MEPIEVPCDIVAVHSNTKCVVKMEIVVNAGNYDFPASTDAEQPHDEVVIEYCCCSLDCGRERRGSCVGGLD